MSHVVQRHVAVDPVVSQLVGHNSPSGIVHKNVKTALGVLDLLRDFLDALPVTQVALHPDSAFGRGISHILGDGLCGTVDDILRHGEDVELGDVVGKKCMGDAKPDALAASCHDGNFSSQIWCLLKSELVGSKLSSQASQVLREGILKCDDMLFLRFERTNDCPEKSYFDLVSNRCHFSFVNL